MQGHLPLGYDFKWLPKCVVFASIFCKISPRRSRTSFPRQVVSPFSSALALCSALGLHNSFHKYLLHNMTRCQKRPRAARKSSGKTIITHLRFFFFFPPVTIAIIFWYLGVTRQLSKGLEIASGRILAGAEQVLGGEGSVASCRSRALNGFKPRNLPPRGLGKLFMRVSVRASAALP